MEEIQNKNCSEHPEANASIYCLQCKIYFCNKCENLHSQLFKSHQKINLGKNAEDFFTGLCKEKNHLNELKYFCKNHNKLCCAACLSKIKDKEYGQHKECTVCDIQDIKENKKNKLKYNINHLQDLSNNIQFSIDELKNVFLKMNENKEKIKIEIQKIFSKIRDEFNKREDELLLEVDQKYNNLYFDDEFLKKSEKLPNLIKNNLEKGKKIDTEWDENSKLKSIINDCIIIENNIMNINKVNEDINRYNSINKIIKFGPESNELNAFIENIKSFGNLYEAKNKEKKYSRLPIISHPSQPPTIAVEEIDSGKLGRYYLA
jgi:hypothetical protein